MGEDSKGRWITPSEALKKIRSHFQTDLVSAVLWVAERIKAGKIAARDEDGNEIASDMWAEWPFLANGAMQFWDTGDITLFPTRYSSARLFGVLFDSSAFPEAMRVVPPISSSNTLSAREAESWYADLDPASKALGLKKLWAKAKVDHHGLRVMRKVIEPFVEGRTTGRPRNK